MNNLKYKVGSHLATKDGEAIGNSVILKVGKRCPEVIAKFEEAGVLLDADEPLITIVTDFGNVLKLIPTELEDMFTVLPPWTEEEASGDFSRRIEDQTSLLEELKELLQNIKLSV